MSSLPLLSVILFSLLIGSILSSRPQLTQRRDDFKDYLGRVGRRRISTRHRLAAMSLNRMESDDEDFEEYWGSGHGETSRKTHSILHYFKDIPRSQWSCCMLGRLAGEKAFSCQAQFYRNSNDWKQKSAFPHSNWSLRRRLSYRSHHSDLTLTLQKCVAGRARDFTKCCSSASMERREKHRWHYYHENRVSNRGF